MEEVPTEVVIVPAFTRRALNFDCVSEDESELSEVYDVEVGDGSSVGKGCSPPLGRQDPAVVITPVVDERERKIASVARSLLEESRKFPLPPPVFHNAPEFFDGSITRAFAMVGTNSKGKISARDTRVRDLPLLDMCPRTTNRKTCHCMELAQTIPFQKDLRTFYCRIIEESYAEMGNRYLMSLMVPRDDAKNKWKMSFKIPGFIDGSRARVFYVCAPQFQKLFGLSTKRFYKLVKIKKKRIEDCLDDDPYFFWNREGNEYVFDGKHYAAFRSKYWIDYMVTHGGYDASDNFD